MKQKIERLKSIDKKLYELKKLYNLSKVYPKNVKEEKEKFFLNKDYNPQFEYEETDINFKAKYKILESIKYSDSAMDSILKEKAQEIYQMLKVLESRGKKRYTKNVTKLYGVPDKKLIRKAEEIISREDTRKKEPLRTISSKRAVSNFNKIFRNLNLTWKAKEKAIASDAVVSPESKTLFIKKGKKLSKKGFKRFIVHEIYTHVLRAEFGLRQPYRVFAIGLAGYEGTEEGLALFKEERADVLDTYALKRYALRVLAVKKALTSSFRETYNYLLKHTFTEENAWDLTLRVKRGMKDTSKAGAFTKDHLYLKGYFEVKEFIKNQSGLHLLHYGKINTKQALKIPTIEGLKNPFVVLKDHFKKNIHELSILY